MTTDDVRDDLQLIYRFFNKIGLDEDHYASEALCRLEAAGLQITAAAEAPDPERVMVDRDDLTYAAERVDNWIDTLMSMVGFDDETEEAEDVYRRLRAALAPASDRSDG